MYAGSIPAQASIASLLPRSGPVWAFQATGAVSQPMTPAALSAAIVIATNTTSRARRPTKTVMLLNILLPFPVDRSPQAELFIKVYKRLTA